MNRSQKRLTAFLVLALIAIIYAIAGQLSYNDAIRERGTYCQMVREGAWPDYRGTYRRECRGNPSPSTGTGRGS